MGPRPRPGSRAEPRSPSRQGTLSFSHDGFVQHLFFDPGETWANLAHDNTASRMIRALKLLHRYKMGVSRGEG